MLRGVLCSVPMIQRSKLRSHPVAMQNIPVLQAVCRRWRRCIQLADAHSVCVIQAAPCDIGGVTFAQTRSYSSSPDRQQGCQPQPQLHLSISSRAETLLPLIAYHQSQQVQLHALLKCNDARNVLSVTAFVDGSSVALKKILRLHHQRLLHCLSLG